MFVAKAAESVPLVAVNPLWTRLSSREGTTAHALHQTVPASLEGELRDWIYYNAYPLPDNAKRLMIRLDLVVPDSYKQDHARAYATYEQKLRERAQKIQAEQAARDTARQADGQSSSTAVMLYSLEPIHPYPPSPPNPQPRFLAYGTSTDQLLDIIDGLLALLPYKPAPPASNDPVVLLVRRARKAMQTKDQREVLQQLLDDGHMIYRVRPDGFGLERRVSPITTRRRSRLRTPPRKLAFQQLKNACLLPGTLSTPSSPIRAALTETRSGRWKPWPTPCSSLQRRRRPSVK